MAILSRPTANRQILAREPARPASARLRRVGLVLAIVAALAALAWFDGGEEPLHPIAQAVDLPGEAS